MPFNSVDTAHIPQSIFDAKGLLIIEEIAIDDLNGVGRIADGNLGTSPTYRNTGLEITMLLWGLTAPVFTRSGFEGGIAQ